MPLFLTLLHRVLTFQFWNRLAYRGGVTASVTPPVSSGHFAGLSVGFNPGASHGLEKGAIIQEVAALHVSVGHLGGARPSISTQIAALRNMLLHPDDGERGQWLKLVLQVDCPCLSALRNVYSYTVCVKGSIPLVITVEKADHIATLLSLKREVEETTQTSLKLTLAGATEAHLLAEEISKAGNVGVILVPSRPFPGTFDQARMLAGPPVTGDTALSVLRGWNVTVGVGIVEEWQARLTRWDVAWVRLSFHPIITQLFH